MWRPRLRCGAPKKKRKELNKSAATNNCCVLPTHAAGVADRRRVAVGGWQGGGSGSGSFSGLASIRVLLRHSTGGALKLDGRRCCCCAVPTLCRLPHAACHMPQILLPVACCLECRFATRLHASGWRYSTRFLLCFCSALGQLLPALRPCLCQILPLPGSGLLWPELCLPASMFQLPAARPKDQTGFIPQEFVVVALVIFLP